MKKELEVLKGIHPGIVLERKIRQKNLKKSQLALMIREYPQTLTAITKGKRDMNTPLALKLEKELGLDEGYFMILQVFYDIDQEKKKKSLPKPDLRKFRRVLFWDTKMDAIDWQRQYKAIIKRVFERGSQQEKDEVVRYYGQDKVGAVLNREGSAKIK